MSSKSDAPANPAPARRDTRKVRPRSPRLGLQDKRATQYLLDLAKAQGYTDYALAARLCVTPQAISRYRRGSTMSDASGHALALLVAIPPEFALACLNGERAKTPELRSSWRNISSLLAGLLSGKVRRPPDNPDCKATTGRSKARAQAPAPRWTAQGRRRPAL
jgi:transcriptional regulator with XRE-family HTH domain